MQWYEYRKKEKLKGAHLIYIKNSFLLDDMQCSKQMVKDFVDAIYTATDWTKLFPKQAI